MEMLNYQIYEPVGGRRGVIVALHGLVESIGCITDASVRWAKEGWTVCALDLTGHGGSPRWVPGPEHPGDVMTEDVIHALKRLLPEFGETSPIVFYGHSAGGGIAAAAAIAEAQWSARVAGVLLEDPFWRLPVSAFQDPLVAEAAGELLESAQSRGHSACISAVQRRWPWWPEDEILAVVAAQRNADVNLVRNGNVIPTQPWPEIVETLFDREIPVLVVTGTIGIGMTAAHQDILRSHSVSVQTIEGASHFVRRDRPDEFAAISAHFLEKCR